MYTLSKRAKRAVRWIVRAIASLTMLTPSLASAQGVDTGTSIVVAVADSLPVANAKAVVLLHASPIGEAVILLPSRSPSPLALAAAAKVLHRMLLEGRLDGRAAMVPIEGFQAPTRFSGAARARMQGVVSRVAAQPFTHVGSLGRGQWTRVSMRDLGL